MADKDFITYRYAFEPAPDLEEGVTLQAGSNPTIVVIQRALRDHLLFLNPQWVALCALIDKENN